MAASSKPTAVHFSLIFFVMATLILALAYYLNFKEYTAEKAKVSAATETAQAANEKLKTALDEMDRVKRKLGYPDFEVIGVENDTSPNTVLGKLGQDLTLHGATQVQPSAANANVAATLQSLRSALNTANAAVDERKLELVNVQTELEQERQSHMQRLTQATDSQKSSETQLAEQVAAKTEVVSEKDREIAKWRDQFRIEQREKESLKDELEALRKQRDVETREFESVVGFLREKLNNLEDLSFDKPDGVIRRVDNTTRTVWINLGSEDGLRPQVSFSVYTKGHQGVGRGNADIKAKIEVTKIRDAHLSEARILTEDLARPIQENDPIYSPVWSKGLKEYFSFVGVLDLDGDGKSDREKLRNILENAGSGIELEVDDSGNRTPEDSQLTVKSKFLVVGHLEDPGDFPGNDTAKQEEIKKVQQQYTDLTKDALRKGIKTVTLRDFLNYIGYEQAQRVYNSNAETKSYPLKSGLQKTGVEDFDAANRLQIPKPSSRFESSK